MNAQPVKKRVLWPNRKGLLQWRTAWRVGNNPPQATRKLAVAFAKGVES